MASLKCTGTARNGQPCALLKDHPWPCRDEKDAKRILKNAQNRASRARRMQNPEYAAYDRARKAAYDAIRPDKGHHGA